MPIISFESGQLNDAVKVELIEKLTATAAEVTGIPKHLFFVSIRELPDNNIAVGGKTVEQLKWEFGKNE